MVLKLDNYILIPMQEVEDEEQSSSKCKALKVFCGKCGNPLGHEFVGDRDDGGSR